MAEPETRGVTLSDETAILYERLIRRPDNAAFRDSVHGGAASAMRDIDLIGVIPGAFHREHCHTGADGARVIEIARQVGIDVQVIPTPSFGGLDEGACKIIEWLRIHEGRRITLVSLSKGGAEIKRALGLPGAESAFAGVRAWVSLSGMVQGTPLVEWLCNRRLRWLGIRAWLWWKGHDMQAMQDLRHDAEAGWPSIPRHLRIVHVYGFPLQRHLVHPWAKRGYARLSSLGPNDGGGILLSDLTRLPGVIYPIWGADHYLAPRWDIVPLLQRIILAAITEPACPRAD